MIGLIYIIGCAISYLKYIGNEYGFLEDILHITNSQHKIPKIKDYLLYNSLFLYILMSWVGFIILMIEHYRYHSRYFFKLNFSKLKKSIK